MNVMDYQINKNDYKTRVKLLKITHNVERKDIAREMGLTYSSFNYRLLGFGPWMKGEEEKLNKILSEKENSKKVRDI